MDQRMNHFLPRSMLAANVQPQPPSGGVGKTRVTLQVQPSCTTGKDLKICAPMLFQAVALSPSSPVRDTDCYSEVYTHLVLGGRGKSVPWNVKNWLKGLTSLNISGAKTPCLASQALLLTSSFNKVCQCPLLRKT